MSKANKSREALIAIGQFEIPGFDLVCEAAEKAFASVIKAALEIKESAKSIIVKIAGIVLRIAGADREDYTAATIRAELAGKEECDQLATLEGLGFAALAGR